MLTADEKTLELLWAEARRRLPEFGCHGIEHTERVYRASHHIGVKEGADLTILLPAAILHDISRGSENHALESAWIAREVLRSAGCEQGRIEAVVEAISTHSFTGKGTPISLEARVLSDADKLDAMGALGVYRAAMYCVENGRPVGDFVDHFHEKLLRLKELLFTDEAKRLAESRHRFMIEFVDQIERELRLEA